MPVLSASTPDTTVHNMLTHSLSAPACCPHTQRIAEVKGAAVAHLQAAVAELALGPSADNDASYEELEEAQGRSSSAASVLAALRPLCMTLLLSSAAEDPLCSGRALEGTAPGDIFILKAPDPKKPEANPFYYDPRWDGWS
jgi:hypothetical protein